eukprot:1194439-Prorocentrum_minimum.AAC.4
MQSCPPNVSLAGRALTWTVGSVHRPPRQGCAQISTREKHPSGLIPGTVSVRCQYVVSTLPSLPREVSSPAKGAQAESQEEQSTLSVLAVTVAQRHSGGYREPPEARTFAFLTKQYRRVL